jgi:demethoxyubiquinone hydroxylase (CLK1/Coq7/Cat5 family)
MKDPPLEYLIAILRLAYSGELAAAYAYRGHWHSIREREIKSRICEIEDEEWHHRRLIGGMLEDLGRKPSRVREIKAAIIGRSLGALCHVTGWLAPMYGAGRLERRNIEEYETAARLALEANHPEYVDCLLTMAEVEWEHEKYFRERVLDHRWSKRMRLWSSPPPREEIRRSFERDVASPTCNEYAESLDEKQPVT